MPGRWYHVRPGGCPVLLVYAAYGMLAKLHNYLKSFPVSPNGKIGLNSKPRMYIRILRNGVLHA